MTKEVYVTTEKNDVATLLLEGFIVTTKISVSRQRITIKAEPVLRQKVLDVGAFYVAT